MNIFVGNLSYGTTEEVLRKAFEQYGAVDAVRVVADRESQRSRGFGFIEMPNSSEAQAAITALDGKEVDGRALRVNEARPRTEERGPRRY